MERKRIAVALAAIAIVGLFAGGSIYAYFSDTESKSTTFAAGTLDLEIGETELEAMSINEVYPGWGISGYYPDSVGEGKNKQIFTLNNVGNMKGKLTLTFPITSSGVGTDGKANLHEYLTVKVSVGAEDPIVMTIAQANVNEPLGLGILDVSDTLEITLEYYIPWGTAGSGNEIMGDELTFNVAFTLEQIPENYP